MIFPRISRDITFHYTRMKLLTLFALIVFCVLPFQHPFIFQCVISVNDIFALFRKYWIEKAVKFHIALLVRMAMNTKLHKQTKCSSKMLNQCQSHILCVHHAKEIDFLFDKRLLDIPHTYIMIWASIFLTHLHLMSSYMSMQFSGYSNLRVEVESVYDYNRQQN